MKTILVVDDEFGIIDALSMLLEDEGYRVVTAPNGKLGLERLKEHKPDLVLIDVMMPIMNGPEMLRKMRSEMAFKHTPVILVTAAPESDAVRDAQQEKEVSAVLRKPFDFRDLMRLISRVIGENDFGPH